MRSRRLLGGSWPKKFAFQEALKNDLNFISFLYRSFGVLAPFWGPKLAQNGVHGDDNDMYGDDQDAEHDGEDGADWW